MPVTTESNRLGDVLIYEADERYCRQVFVCSGTVALGQVCEASTTKKVASAKASVASDSVALAAGVDGERVPFLVRGPSIVNKTGLTYGAGASDAEKLATDVLLLAKGILVRT